MGGGDLNSKKSWHPNTMKNQERVWKAEQAAAEEKKKMIELQRERAEERDRAELNNLIKNDSGLSTDNRLSWMYDKPDKKVDQEAYLLGKALNKNAEQDKTEDVIPAVSRRVVGSSMITATGDAQVDMTRKLREDPLLLIKERERAARAALLNNPLQRRKLAELLRKEQASVEVKDQRKESKDKKKSKKKSNDLDGILAAKLSALGGQKGIDLATLLNSDDSSSDSSSSDDSHKKTKKRKRKKSHKVKKSKKKRDISSNSEYNRSVHKRKIDKDANPSKKQSSKNNEFGHERVSRKRQSSEEGYDSDGDVPKKSRNDSSDRRERNERGRVQRQDRTQYNRREDGHKSRDRRGGLSETERAARLADMAAAGAERERRRAERVGRQRAGDAAPAPAPRAPRPQHALPDSLEARLRSNRHYIQRDKRHMNEHFARR